MAVATAEEIHRICLLDDVTSFQLWKFEIKILLEAKGLLQYIDNADNTEEKIQTGKDAMTKHIILQSVSKKHKTQLFQCTTAYEIFNCDVFEGTEERKKMNLLQDFYNYKFENDISMDENFTKLENLIHRLTQLKMPFDDAMIESKILNILSNIDNYQSFVTAWESTPKEERTLKNLRIRLVKEEKRKNENIQSVALAAENKGRMRKNTEIVKNGGTVLFDRHGVEIRSSGKIIAGKKEDSGLFVVKLDKQIKFEEQAYLSNEENENSAESWHRKLGHPEAERESNLKVVTIRCDNDGEYTSHNFKSYCIKKGIKLDYSVPYCPQLNGKVEHLNRTIHEKIRSLLYMSEMKKEMWGEALYCSVYLLNRLPSESINNKTPFELWYGRLPNLSNVREFGCDAFAKILPPSKKLDARAVKYRMIGYTNNGYRLQPEESLEHRTRKLPEKYKDYVLLTYEEVLKSPEKEKWERAIESELNSLEENNVWKIVDQSESYGHKTLTNKWVFRIKEDGKYKTRLVVRGNEQQDVNYDDIFSPVAS
ncbi:uncharacterized protein LOC131843970 [Achroia grisella]|uniref:uncharacterized protein LOC131843970 n=1 Tax=Achroia grisella TaxID=688607 RepID=UPI0027D350CC|nr:uncharacterized protein LOC131843970 [Achroia grisella]